jgi:hypothetical protein
MLPQHHPGRTAGQFARHLIGAEVQPAPRHDVVVPLALTPSDALPLGFDRRPEVPAAIQAPLDPAHVPRLRRRQRESGEVRRPGQPHCPLCHRAGRMRDGRGVQGHARRGRHRRGGAGRAGHPGVGGGRGRERRGRPDGGREQGGGDGGADGSGRADTRVREHPASWIGTRPIQAACMVATRVPARGRSSFCPTGLTGRAAVGVQALTSGAA